MREIEKKMVVAVADGRHWKLDNTEVTPDGEVFLYGNLIAFKVDGKLERCDSTFKRWPTATTKSRLRALGLATA